MTKKRTTPKLTVTTVGKEKMALRVLLLLLSLTILANIIILVVSLIFNVNLYKKHGKAILNGFGLFILLIVITYTVLAVIGLV